MVPPPATEDMKGSTTVIANAVATAASTALPPRARMPAPTSAPSGCSAATRARALGVCLVTERVERIMRVSFANSNGWSRHVQTPASWVSAVLGMGVVEDAQV